MNAAVQREITPGLVAALGEVYTSLRRDHPDLPLALVTVEEPHPAVRFRVACWRAGRFVTEAGVFEGRIAFGYPSAHRDVPRLLFTGAPAAVLEVLVHESAHALATAREIKDTSRHGTYHNDRFRELATELGLVVTKSDYGWDQTKPSETLLARYAWHLDSLAAARPGDELNGTGQ